MDSCTSPSFLLNGEIHIERETRIRHLGCFKQPSSPKLQKSSRKNKASDTEKISMREFIFGGMTQNHNLMTRPHQNMNKYLPGEESTLWSEDSL